MANIIDLNAITSQVYNLTMSLNGTISNLVGVDAMYCRLVPEKNSEDIIVQEYTLFGYECPKTLKVVMSNTDYQPGNFMIDAWGIHQDVPLEINIDINVWQNAYGANTMPQKGDFILIQKYHEPYEVASSQVVKAIGECPTTFKCMLSVWKHNANRKESEAFKNSIDELTVSQESMFGEAIAREVADAVVDVETAFNTNTLVDPIKDVELDSVEIADDLQGVDGNTFATAYYSFIKMTQPMAYDVSASFDVSAKANHWIYTCWFKTENGSDDIQNGGLKILDVYLKEKDYWYFHIQSGMKIEEGENVSIYRGASLKINGTIVKEKNEKNYAIKILSSDCFQASKKIANWWSSGIWKIQKQTSFNLLKCYDGDDNVLSLTINGNELNYTINGIRKSIMLTKGKPLSFEEWHYFAFDMTASNVRILLVRNKLALSNKYTNKVVVDEVQTISANPFVLDYVEIDNVGIDFCMTNMRLYENHAPLGDNYKMDMYSQITKNANKLIFVDSPKASNKMSFITTIR